ncbi:hypothetical protein GCM10007082_24670 [Oceanisphaera arctica]|nr:hypothetical protein GCM10007082_24670 [Oceanisphaera arctica]
MVFALHPAVILWLTSSGEGAIFPQAYSLFPIPYSPLPIPYSPFPIPHSPFPADSLKSIILRRA